MSDLVKHSPFEEASGVAVSGVDGIDGEVVPLDAVDDRHRQSPTEKNEKVSDQFSTQQLSPVR